MTLADFWAHFISSDGNKVIRSARSTVLDAVPIASNLLFFIESVLPLAFGMHLLFRINKIAYCNKTKKDLFKASTNICQPQFVNDCNS